MYRWLLCGALACASGCLPSPGPCDQNGALELVYQEDGTPAFAGQAIVQVSCGNGGFCHGSLVDGAQDRYGAPMDLGFDVTVASTSSAVQAADTERLREHLLRVLSMRREILQQIQQGQMPPGGDVGAEYRGQVMTAYDRFEDDGVTFSPLPTLLDDDPARRDEAEEIVRNWLSCRTPVVERTEDRMDRGDNVVGFTIAACERSCIDVTWASIYAGLIQPSCATSACHDADDPAGTLDLETGGAGGVHGRIVDRPGQGAQCGPASPTPGEPGVAAPTVAPMDAEGSLLFLKVAAESGGDVCGSRMPLTGSPLSPQRLCALRAWIDCGACGEGDASCDACLAMARADCNVDTSTESGCASTAPCVNRASL